MLRRACASGAAARSRTSDVAALTPWIDWAFAGESGAAEGGLNRRHPRESGASNQSNRSVVANGSPAFAVMTTTYLETQIMAPRVLISDALSSAAVQIFKNRGIEVDFQPKLGADKEKLAEISAVTTGSRSARPPR